MQKETRRIYSIMYSERFENAATVKAGALVKAGAIGKVVQTVGLGPHRMNLTTRPEWFFHRSRFGGIICDIGSHQADQFLFFTGSTRADVVASQVGNVHHPQYPGFEDFGDVVLRGDAGRATSASTGSHRTGSAPGATAGLRSWVPMDTSRSARTSTSPEDPAAVIFFWWTRKRRATSTAAKSHCLTANNCCQRHPQPHRDRNVAGTLLPRNGTGAQSTEAGAKS